MSCKVFIDGSSGTTGLRIAERLARRPELELLSIPEAGRKDLETRAEVINAADLAFLCLPDAASREILPRIGGPGQELGNPHHLPPPAGGGGGAQGPSRRVPHRHWPSPQCGREAKGPVQRPVRHP